MEDRRDRCGTATRNAAPAQPAARRPVEMVAKTEISAGAGQNAYA
ncbi:hypothetical protein ACFSTC_30370 [Nonomuraea ferruginea]